MKLTMPEGLGLLGAVIVGVLLVLGSQAAPPRQVSGSEENLQEVPGTAVREVKDKPALEAQPPSKPGIRNETGPTIRPLTQVPPRNPRAITLFPRDERQLQIVKLPTTPEGVVTYKCRGGIKIVCESQKIGTIQMEADEAVIKRVEPENYEERAVATKGVGWIDEADLRMEVRLKGNAIVRQDQEKFAGKGRPARGACSSARL